AAEHCGKTTTAILTHQVTQADLAEGVAITCAGGQTFFTSNSGGNRAPISGPAVQIGSACSTTWTPGINLTQISPSGLRTGSWNGPPGPEAPTPNSATSTLVATTDLAGTGLAASQADLYHELVYASYDRTGKWDGSRCAGGSWVECGRQYRPEGAGTSAFDPCIKTEAYTPDPPPCDAACQQPVVTLEAGLNQDVVAGTITRWPRPAQPPKVGAVVNLPVQYAVQGWSLNGQQSPLRRWQVTIIGPPDGHGRSRVFTFVVSLGLIGVDWNYGDGQTSHYADESGFGQDIHPPDGSSTVTHSYDTISEPAPYHVVATQTWGVRVDEYWLGGGHTEVSGLEQQFSVQAAADVEVGQIEAIPVTCHDPACGG
ncbi:MAG: hypothetical protein M3024_08150, partial [Candidatus Dormibacteraeota bacterium]|nr:hypothetical protein [Candidatus Dormibacteraeota bacterium]